MRHTNATSSHDVNPFHVFVLYILNVYLLVIVLCIEPISRNTIYILEYIPVLVMLMNLHCVIVYETY